VSLPLPDMVVVPPQTGKKMSQLNDIKKLITTTDRRLQKLKLRQAQQGINVDPAVEIEIEDLEEKLADLNRQLKQAQMNIASSASSSMTAPVALPENKSKSEKDNKNSLWVLIGVPIIVALIGLAGVIITVWATSSGDTPSPIPTTPAATDTFTYNVRVQDRSTTDGIANAVVTIEVGGRAPLDGITDSTGLARIFVSASHAGQPGRLIVEADGYERYRQEIDIVEGALPDIVPLEK